MQKTNLILAVLILLSAQFTACATPAAVKTLSAEQAKTLQEYQESQKKYFSVIEKFVDTQIQAVIFQMKELNRELEKKLRLKATKELERANNDAAAKVVDQLIKEVNENAEGDLQKRESLFRLSQSLKHKHGELLGAYAVLVSAQKKLDEYIQTAKADEVLTNQLLIMMGVQQAKVESAFTDVADFLGKIQNFSREEHP